MSNDTLDMNTLQERIDEVSKKSNHQYRQQLNHSIHIMLLDKEESGFPPILRTINRHLRQYKLEDRISPYEVFKIGRAHV